MPAPADTTALKDQLLARFARYVRVGTTADEQSKSVPSTPGQLELGRLLAAELRTLGLTDAAQDEHGYVYAGLPASPGVSASVPAVGFIAHVDTSPQVTGHGVVPQVHRAYAGGEVVINRELGVVLSPATCPELAAHHGHDLVTASGHTLLGADNKAGVAIIMTLVAYLLAHPELPHSPLRVAFTVDEEIGRGMNHFDVQRFGARYAYTLDGDVLGNLEYECFNADAAVIEITGRSIHPGTAKNRLVNALRVAADIVSAWPENRLPEATEGREGFVLFMELSGTVERARLTAIVRDHDLTQLKAHEELLSAIVTMMRTKHAGATIGLAFTEQYRNMRSVIDQHPAVLSTLLAAFGDAGITPAVKPIRGGTDGSRLSFMGVPTPNLFTGGCNYHARDEWVSLDSMAAAVRVLVALAARYTQA